jgi:GH24 family phage-related lysozyme (muramidase)
MIELWQMSNFVDCVAVRMEQMESRCLFSFCFSLGHGDTINSIETKVIFFVSSIVGSSGVLAASICA